MGPRHQSQLYAKWRSKWEERELPQAELKWVGNETHLVLLRYNLALGHSPELAGGAASNT